jgi:hypothetical protein
VLGKTAQRNFFGRKQGYKHAKSSAPSLRTGHFTTVYPHTASAASDASFRGGRPRISTCICVFQCSAILFSLLSTAHGQNSAGRSVTVYFSEELTIRVREQSIRVSIYQKFSTIHTYPSPGLPMKRSSIADRGLRSVHTVSVTHPASYPVDTGGSFPVVKAIGTLR